MKKMGKIVYNSTSKKEKSMNSYSPLEEAPQWLGKGLSLWIQRANTEGDPEYPRRLELSEEIAQVWKKQEPKLDLSRKAGEPISEFPSEIGEFTFLRGIDASDNDLTTLPPLGKLKKLEFLNLNGNQFSVAALLPLAQLSRKCVVYVHENGPLSWGDPEKIFEAVEQVREIDSQRGPTFHSSFS